MGNNSLRVILGRGREHKNLKELTHLLQKREAVRPNIESDRFFSLLQSNFTSFLSPNRVDESLVQIQHQKLLLAFQNKSTSTFWFRQSQAFLPQVILRRPLQRTDSIHQALIQQGRKLLKLVSAGECPKEILFSRMWLVVTHSLQRLLLDGFDRRKLLVDLHQRLLGSIRHLACYIKHWQIFFFGHVLRQLLCSIVNARVQSISMWEVIGLIFWGLGKGVGYKCNVVYAQFSITLFNIAMSEVKNKANQPKTKKIKKPVTQEHDNQAEQVKSNKSTGKQDSRFSKASYDPKFMAPSQKITKVKIDKRFNKMMNDPAFQNQSTIDRYGRRVNPKDVNNELKEYYYMEDEKPEVEDEVNQQENEQSNEIEEEKQGITEWMENYDEESSELSDVLLDFDEEDIDRVWDDESEHVIKGEDVVATRRLALCNYDWMNISSKDLMLLFSSFKTSSGFIKSVKVYMSNIGKEKLQLEEKYGPQGIWRDVPAEEQRENKAKDWKKSWKQLLEERQDDNNAFDEKKLRQYEKQRLKYFYAVIECDSARAADEIYKECDGNQFQNSNLPFDLRFIPDEIEFDPSNLKEECKDVPVGGQVKNFITKALGHSKVSLSWEDPQLSVAASLKRKNWNRMSQKELDNVDWSMYINTEEADKEDGMKKIVNENIKDQEFVSDWKKSYNKKYRKQEDDIEIAFEGGFDTKNKNKKRGKVVEEEEEVETEKKQRKSMKERRRENEQLKAKRREQLELIVQDNKKTDFNINLNDERFKAVYENPFYSIDPVDSRFDHRKSGKVFAQVVRRNKDKSQK